MQQTRDTDLAILMNALATSFKLIASAVNRAGVAKLYGLAGEVEVNSTGDDQKKLDVMINALVNSGVCSVLDSEQNNATFGVIKAIASTRFMSKDFYTLMENVLKMTVQSQQESLRQVSFIVLK